MGWANITSVPSVNPKQFHLTLAETPFNQRTTQVGFPGWGRAADEMAEPVARSAWLPWLHVVKKLPKSN